MKVVSLLIGGASANFAEIAETINSGNHGWTAQVPSRFAGLEDVVMHLGAFVPGDAEFKEPDVVELVPTNGDLPAEFDSATNWPQCTVIANVRDQSACGSCWAFGSTASFESRRCITTGQDIKFSVEDTAFCQQGWFGGAGNGCNGGNSAWNFFVQYGVVTGGDYTDTGSGDSCLPYTFAPCAHHVPATASYPVCPSTDGPNPTCNKACSEDAYGTSYGADKTHASRAYSVRGVSNIMQDLVQNGPMYVSLNVYGDFPTYKSGVYTHQTGSKLGGHAVTLVGYGTEDGTDFWNIKNSWNDQWGAAGHILIKRGVDECGIESNVNAGSFSSTEIV